MAKFYKYLKCGLFLIFIMGVFNICCFAIDLDTQEINIKSFDGSDINLILRQSTAKQEPVFVFINDYSEKKEKWNPLLQIVMSRNFSVVTYNLREFLDFSRGDRRLDNNDYDYRPAYFLRDLDKMLVFLDINYNIKANQLVLIGAGLGANIALKYATGDKNIKSVILISPKKEYKRISTQASIRNYGNRPIMLVTSMNDKESYDTCLDYMSYLSRNKDVRLKLYYIDRKPMDFLQEKIVVEDINDWIKKYYK